MRPSPSHIPQKPNSLERAQLTPPARRNRNVSVASPEKCDGFQPERRSQGREVKGAWFPINSSTVAQSPRPRRDAEDETSISGPLGAVLASLLFPLILPGMRIVPPRVFLPKPLLRTSSLARASPGDVTVPGSAHLAPSMNTRERLARGASSETWGSHPTRAGKLGQRPTTRPGWCSSRRGVRGFCGSALSCPRIRVGSVLSRFVFLSLFPPAFQLAWTLVVAMVTR